MKEKKENVKELSTLLFAVWNRYKALYEKRIGADRVHLSETEIEIMKMLDRGARTVVGDVSKSLNLPKSTVTGLIGRLEHKRLIRRNILPDDLRTFALELTAIGRREIRKQERSEEAFFEQLIEPLSEKQSRTLIELLKSIAIQGGDENAIE